MNNKILDAINKLKTKKIVTLKNYLETNIYSKKIAIYGAGAFGKEILQLFQLHNIEVECLLDINKKGNLLGVPIIHPKDHKNKNITVIFSLVITKKERELIFKSIQEFNYNTIIDAQKIRALYVMIENGEHTYQYFKDNITKILKTLNILEDKESKETYTKNIISHILRDYSNTMESDEKEQYFLTRVDYKNNFTSFIDCGAYTGDTFLKLIETGFQVEEYVGFEPIESSYKKLVSTVKSKDTKATLLPFAVSNEFKKVSFESNLGSSRISDQGSIEVTCVRIDDILYNQKPTFIKMDIEGEEINALNGAKETIFSSNSNLAICVYHYINHFWEIPNMLHSWNINYKFYMRTHSSGCMETVLYAVKKN